MRALACIALLLPATLATAVANPDVKTLQNRCAEQERQIVSLEKEVDSLHDQLALERRRSRGAHVAAPLPAVPKAEATRPYKVQPGDTLTGIAKHNGTTPELLMKLNGIKDPTRLRIGQTIKVTGSAPSVAAAPTPKKKAPTPSSYVVQAGDTFYKVAMKNSVTVAHLETLNPGVDPGRILIGQTLGVRGAPRKAIPPVAKAPRPSGSKLITTPTKKTAPTPKPAPKSAPAPAPAPEKKAEVKPTKFSSIIVMEQISFGAFAEKHGTTPEQLNALNGLNLKASTPLAKGSELYVLVR